jgi:Protein of unknown function (DUF1453)
MDRQTTTYLVTFAVVALFMGVRIWRGAKARKLKVERMWIRPVIVLAILGLSIASQPPTLEPITLVVLALLIAVGFALGMLRGRMVKVSINPETHDLTSQQSPWGTLIFLAVMVVRTGARFVLRGEQELAGIPVSDIIDGLTLFYAGNVVGMQVDVWMRANKLLQDAIAQKAAGQSVPAEVTQDHAGEKAHG